MASVDDAIVETAGVRLPSANEPASAAQNLAVVGCGYWGKNLVRNFAQLGVLRLICDSNAKSLQTQGGLYRQAEVTESFDAVLADSRVKAVVLATPAVMHYSQVKQALNAGKDVFVEKPLALHHAEGKELVELAEEKNWS